MTGKSNFDVALSLPLLALTQASVSATIGSALEGKSFCFEAQEAYVRKGESA